MKKIYCILIIPFLLLAGCGGNSDNSSSTNAMKSEAQDVLNDYKKLVDIQSKEDFYYYEYKDAYDLASVSERLFENRYKEKKSKEKYNPVLSSVSLDLMRLDLISNLLGKILDLQMNNNANWVSYDAVFIDQISSEFPVTKYPELQSVSLKSVTRNKRGDYNIAEMKQVLLTYQKTLVTEIDKALGKL